MKLRTMAMVVIGVGALAGGCKKKPKEGTPTPEQMQGSATPGSGTGAAPGSAEPAKEAKLEGKALADKYIECTNQINEGKFDDFAAKCLAKDYKGHQADGPDIMGADGFVEFFKGQKTAMPDMKLQPQLVLVNDRNILSVVLITGTHTGPMKSPTGEVPATNKKIGQLMFHRLAISDDNRATEEWAYYDPATMASQLGLLPKEVPPLRPAMDKGIEGAPVIVVATNDDKEKKNVEAAKKSSEAFAARKVADIMATYTDDAVESDHADVKDYKGKKEIQASHEMLLKGFPDFKFSGEPAYFAAGDYVVMLGVFEGTNTGPLGPLKPTKKKATGQFAEVMKIKDGKIAELWRFRNGMAMAMQLGLMKAPEAPAGGGSAAPAGGSAAPKGDAPKGDAKKEEAPKKG